MQFQAAKSSKKPMNTTAIIEQAGLKARKNGCKICQGKKVSEDDGKNQKIKGIGNNSLN